MTDLHERFHNEFDQVPVPDLWDRIERLAETETVAARQPRSRLLVAVAAAVAALVLIGGPLLLLASTGQEEPVADSSTTLPEPRTLTEVDPPWGETISGVAITDDGGIVAILSSPDGVYWSPDRMSWFDADPDRQVTPRYPGREERQFGDRIIVSASGRVAIRSEANDGVWIAAPETGHWQFYELRDSEAGDQVERVLSLAANDTDVLVVTHTTSNGAAEPTHTEAPGSVPTNHQYAVWLIDTHDGTTERHILPLPTPEWAEDPMAIADSFNGQWFIAVHRNVWTDTDEGWLASTPVMTSPDGRSWTIQDSNFPPTSATSISFGSTGMIATECNFGGDSFWYSDDGINWEVTTTDHMGHRSVYVDGLGFFTYYQGSPTAYSPDGRAWQLPLAAGITVHQFDDDYDPDDPTTGGLFVIDDRLMYWSIDKPQDNEDETG